MDILASLGIRGPKRKPQKRKTVWTEEDEWGDRPSKAKRARRTTRKKKDGSPEACDGAEEAFDEVDEDGLDFENEADLDSELEAALEEDLVLPGSPAPCGGDGGEDFPSPSALSEVVASRAQFGRRWHRYRVPPLRAYCFCKTSTTICFWY